jgi:hypothetical protein
MLPQPCRSSSRVVSLENLLILELNKSPSANKGNSVAILLSFIGPLADKI